MRTKETIELCGTFEGERYVFQHGTAKRCILANIYDGKTMHTIKGECQRNDLTVGTWYRFDGFWSDNPKYGRQFIFTSWGEPIPQGQKAIEAYLSECLRIGTIRARKIYESFGEESLEVIKADPQKLADAISIRLEHAREIADNLKSREATEQYTIELKTLLSGYGFPKRLFSQIKKDLGTGAPEMIKKNPFILLQFNGTGFERCDQLYLSLGLSPDAMIRQIEYLKYVIASDFTGSVWIAVNNLAVQFREKFGETARLTEAIEAAVESEVLVCEKEFVALTHFARQESFVAEWLYRAKERMARWPQELLCDENAKPSEHQLAEYRKATQSAVCCFTGSPGSGKGQPLTAKVLTPSGWNLMGNVSVGDEVITKNGTPTKITAIFPQGIKPCYRITFSDDSSTECDESHLWVVCDKLKKRPGIYEVIDTETLAKNNLYQYEGKWKRWRYYIPVCDPVHFIKRSSPKITPWLLGVLIGDGLLRTKGLVISNTESDLLQRIQEEIVNYDCKLIQYDDCNFAIKKCRGKKNQLKDAVFLYGLCVKSHEKFIPDDYKFGSIETRTEIIRGLMDTDGTVSNGHLTFSTSSLQLAKDITFVIQSLGGTAKISRKKNCGYKDAQGKFHLCKDSYTLYIKCNICLVSSKKHLRKIKQSQVSVYRQIRSITRINDQQTRCISIADSSRLYLTNDFIVTHNTWVIARMIQTIQQDQDARIAVCAPTGKAAQRIRESMAAQGVVCDAPTIHSLLQAQSDEDGFRFLKNEDDPLEHDFLLIDESSMIDISLLWSFLRAVNKTANVMFIGDPDQLSPVGRGAPLRDMLAANLSQGTLAEIRRNAGDIVTACAAIRDKQPIPSFTKNIEDSEHNLVIVPTAQNTDAMFSRIKEVYEFETSVFPSSSVLTPQDFQVIVAINEKSDLSRKIFNERLQDFFNPLVQHEKNRSIIESKQNFKKFRPGDKIICLTNGNAELAKRSGAKIRIANGDIGRVEGFWKSSLHVETNDVLIDVPMHSDTWGMSDWDLGYAISCHKSQGSQWPVVVILLDGSRAASTICDRHWIYTAISRAVDRCYLLGPPSLIETMSRKSKMWERKTKLVERLDDFQAVELINQFQEFLNVTQS